jgi:pimeloyl-ACP methyl ester carboxylesterase
MQHVVEVDAAGRRLAVLVRAGTLPPVVWFGGFRSDMRATKAEALDAWAAEDGTISQWLADARAVLDSFAPERPILVGSSMGAWLALLASLGLSAEHPIRAPAALILVAPAVDFTEALIWDRFSPVAKKAMETEGVFLRPSAYGDPYPITRALIEDGRQHLLLDGPITPGCPVHILQGMRDEDVPWEHALKLVSRLPGENVQITLIKDGDHRLSRPEDIDRLIRAIEAACRAAST